MEITFPQLGNHTQMGAWDDIVIMLGVDTPKL